EALGIRGEGLTVGGASAAGNLALAHGARLVRWGILDVCLVVGALAEPAPADLRSFLNLGAMVPTGGSGPGGPFDRCHRGLGHGARLARWGILDVCLVVGALDEPAPAELRSFLNLGAMVPTVGSGPGGPFDRSHRGFVHGPAAAAVILESAGSAARRDAPVLAGLAGCAAGLDANSQPDPTVAGEADVMTRALGDAGIGPADVDLVAAHGTGSPLGDRVEADALAQVFGRARPWVNAVKGLAGHALTAAGLLSAVAVVVQLRDGFVHPNPWLREPIDGAPRLAGDTAVTTRPRWAVSNAFGFGGFNSAVVWRAAG